MTAREVCLGRLNLSLKRHCPNRAHTTSNVLGLWDGAEGREEVPCLDFIKTGRGVHCRSKYSTLPSMWAKRRQSPSAQSRAKRALGTGCLSMEGRTRLARRHWPCVDTGRRTFRVSRPEPRVGGGIPSVDLIQLGRHKKGDRSKYTTLPSMWSKRRDPCLPGLSSCPAKKMTQMTSDDDGI